MIFPSSVISVHGRTHVHRMPECLVPRGTDLRFGEGWCAQTGNPKRERRNVRLAFSPPEAVIVCSLILLY